MIYTKNIEQISWNDVTDFCNQKIPEGSTLDYKKDFPNNLQKTIAAFGNTLGGIIIIGIDEDDHNKPKPPFEGIEFKRGLSERVMNIILTNITPPIFPEIKICSNESDTRAFVIIRIAQSHQSPHAINNNANVYIRTANRNSFEELATIDKIFWLKEKRENSLSLRNELIENADSRFFRIASTKEEVKNIDDNIWLSVSMIPLFPKDYFITPYILRQNLERFLIKDIFYTSSSFPISEKYSGILYQDGIVLDYYYNERAYYCELNSYGLYYYRQNLHSKFSGDSEYPKPIIRFREVVARLYEIFASAKRYFELIGYKGYLYFEFKTNNLYRFPLSENNLLKSSIDDKLYYKKEFNIKEIDETSLALYVEVLNKLCWAYDFHINETYLESIIKSLS